MLLANPWCALINSDWQLLLDVADECRQPPTRSATSLGPAWLHTSITFTFICVRCAHGSTYCWITLSVQTGVHVPLVGLARTGCIHRVWPYTWWFPSQNCRIYTVFIGFWPTLTTRYQHQHVLLGVRADLHFQVYMLKHFQVYMLKYCQVYAELLPGV